KINEKAKSLNVEVEFKNPRITITQSDPWNVKVILNSKLIIKDKGGLVRWERTTPLYTYIPIDNFEDPIYILNTANSENKFEKTKYSLPISAEDLLLHAENSYYVSNPNDAPSFLQRLQGDLYPDPNHNGIESLVNVHELSLQGTQPKDKCIIDYIYFSPTTPEITYTSNGWIKLCGDYSGRYIS
ncbi:MAG: hypothetical protein Q8N63_08795, partial [Nanoarchaeota archaeon]|nr:hypothetical protein [Nanoarchaeota archaeon]